MFLIVKHMEQNILNGERDEHSFMGLGDRQERRADSEYSI